QVTDGTKKGAIIVTRVAEEVPRAYRAMGGRSKGGFPTMRKSFRPVAFGVAGLASMLTLVVASAALAAPPPSGVHPPPSPVFAHPPTASAEGAAATARRPAAVRRPPRPPPASLQSTRV